MLQDTLRQRRGRMAKENDEIVNLAEMIVKDGFHTTSTELNAIAEGVSYVTGFIFPAVAANGFAVMHIKSGSKKLVITYSINCEGLIYYSLNTSPTITTNGTPVLVSSRNQVTIVPTTASAFHTPTYSNIGTPGLTRMNSAASGAARGSNGGGDSRTVVIGANKSVLIVAQNRAVNSAIIGITADWIEVT